MPASFLAPGAPTRTSQRYDQATFTSSCLGRLRVYDVPLRSEVLWKDVKKKGDLETKEKQTKQVYKFKHMHYRLQGKDLENMSPYEYAALIHIEHRPDIGQNSTKGCNKWFEFDKASHLHPWWVQKLGSAMPTLILSSWRPKWPGLLLEEASDEEQKKHKEQLNNFGAYYVALFWPRVGCYAGSDCDLTKHNWSGFCSMAKCL